MVIALAVPSLAWAQALADPTRPPPAILAAQAKGAAPGPTGVPATEEDNTPRVQMLSIGKSQKYAVISGRVVRVGGMIDGAKLVEVRPNAVILQSPEGTRETINLYPGIEIRAAKSRDAAQAKESTGKAKGREGASGNASKKENR